jgi:probable addiction module antidote protein
LKTATPTSCSPLSPTSPKRGIARVAADAGLGRESLYKTLAPGSKPRMDTVFKLLRALGVKLNAVPEGAAAA